MAAGLSPWAFVLAAIGLWFLVEGLVYGAFPDTMRRFLDWAARLPVSELRSAGLWTAALGAVLVYVALRFS